MPSSYAHGAARRLPAAAALLAGLATTTPALADEAATHVVKLLTPVIEIESDGEHYTKPVIPLVQVAASVNVALDAGISGRIKSYKVWLKFRSETSDWADFPQHATSESFALNERPKALNNNVYVSIPYGSHASYLVSYCNLQANALRHGGMTDQQIFSQDRPIEVGVHSDLQYEMSGVDGTVSTSALGGGWSILKKMTVVCKGVPPARVPPPVANDPTRDKPEVLEADLSIIEQHSLQGACAVSLSGVIRTGEPNTEVKFRYRSKDGRQSDVKTATSDHSAMAMFSHDFPLSPGGVRTGELRIVGVSSTFASQWEDYSVNCGSPAQGFASNDPTPPDLTLNVAPYKEKMYKGFACPLHAGMDGRIMASDAYEGRAIFIAAQQGVAEPQSQVDEQSFDIVQGQRWAVAFSPEVRWNNVPVVGGNPPKQTMKLTFQVARHGKVVASTQKMLVLSCRKVQANGVGQGAPGGLTGKPKPTASQQPMAPGPAMQSPGQPQGTPIFLVPGAMQ